MICELAQFECRGIWKYSRTLLVPPQHQVVAPLSEEIKSSISSIRWMLKYPLNNIDRNRATCIRWKHKQYSTILLVETGGMIWLVYFLLKMNLSQQRNSFISLINTYCPVSDFLLCLFSELDLKEYVK